MSTFLPDRRSPSGAERACLIYDVENVGGGIDRARQVRRLLDENGIRLRHVILAGPHQQLRAVSDAFRDCERLDERACPHGKQFADVDLATQAGICLVPAVQFGEYDALVIASADAAVIRCGRPWIDAGILTVIATRAADASHCAPTGYCVLCYDALTKKRSPAPPEFDADVYPFYFDTVPTNVDGLLVVRLPSARDPVPTFIPLPLTAEEVRIGARSGACDITLHYWDPDGKGGLYSPHAFIGYSATGWYVRSAHGFRRGRRITRLNDSILAAQLGNVPLSGGDILRLGAAQFRFQIRPDTDFATDPPCGDNAHDQLAAVERWFHHEIAEVLGRLCNDWWTTKIPPEIQASCTKRMPSGGSTEHPYRYTVLRELQDIILSSWVEFSNTSIQHHWRSKSQLRRTFSDLIEIRNKLMHPTRLSPTEMELGLLSRLSQQLFCQ